MEWDIGFSRNSKKFLEKNHLNESFAIEYVKLSINKLSGLSVNVHIKKLSGKWAGAYRIRVGKIRIICYFHFDRQSVLIEEIDFRGNIYK
ncbi:MAG TPA: type II toxin-antitoxin system RelE/ParE family toxin [Candidatus Paceibacterota bacterium]